MLCLIHPYIIEYNINDLYEENGRFSAKFCQFGALEKLFIYIYIKCYKWYECLVYKKNYLRSLLFF